MRTFESILNEANETARNELIYFLGKCSEGSILKFKHMYANGDLDLPISDVIKNMPVEKLGWAMTQVFNTLEKELK